MYKLDITPGEVRNVLGSHILADGYDLVFDMEKSRGVYIYDSKNQRRLLDFFTCFASVPLGYNHEKMLNDEAFKKSLLQSALINPSNSDIYTIEYAQFIQTFSRVGIPDYLPHAFFISGGSLAIENAIKAAMDWKVQLNFRKGHRTEKGHQVIHFEQAFHGRSGYTLSLTNTNPDKIKWFAKFDWPRIPFPFIHFPLDSRSLQEVIRKEEESVSLIRKAFESNPDDICAIITEPVQSEGGDRHARPEFFEKLRALCDEFECLLIYDEVQTGVGLSGKFWLHEHYGEHARPDLLAFGKKMQVCGVLAGRKLDQVEENVFTVSSRINSTWGGSLADMVRSSKIMEIIEEDGLCTQASETGAYLQRKLAELSLEFSSEISNVRGRGLLSAFDFRTKEKRDAFIKEGANRNVMFLGCAEQTIRFRPALIIDNAHIDEGIGIAREILNMLGKSSDGNSLLK